jgi:hypothetical protein
MKRMTFFASLIMAGLLFAVSVAQNAQGTKAPLLPKAMHPVEHEQLYQVIRLLSKSEFEQAGSMMKMMNVPATVKIYASWASIPAADRDAYRRSSEEAIANWNRVLGGSPKFELTTNEQDADIYLFFEYDVAQITAGQFRLVHNDARLNISADDKNPASKRVALVRIAVQIPYTEMSQPPTSIAHLVGQGVGSYLGLIQSQDDKEIMGPTWNSDQVSKEPTADEVKHVRELLDIRRQLNEFASKKIALYMPRPVMVIAQAEIDAGDVARGDNAKYVFTIKNTGDAPLELDAKPNCGCTVANFDKIVQPGEEGKVEAEIRTQGFRGKIMKAIDLTSNDPDTPRTSLRMAANVMPIVQVLPSENLMLSLKDNEATVQELEIQVSNKEEIQIEKVTTTAAYATAKVEPIAGAEGRHKLIITISPDAPLGRSAFLVTANTNSPKEPQINVSVQCEKGIIVTPVSVYMGSIMPNTQLPVEQIVTMVKRGGTFNIKKIESEDPNISIREETLENGSQHRLILTYNGGWQPGAIRRMLKVETNDPKQPTIEIQVFANVIGASN